MSKVKTIKVIKEKIHSVLLGDTSMLIQMERPLEDIEVPYNSQTVSELIKHSRDYPDTEITEFGSR